MTTNSLTRLSSGFVFLASLFFVTAMPHSAIAGEADLVIPSLDRPIAIGLSGQMMLMGGVAISVMGLAFGILIYAHLKSMPVHKSMLEVSDLIYETCKTYLKTQGVELGTADYERGFRLFVHAFQKGMVAMPEPFASFEDKEKELVDQETAAADEVVVPPSTHKK